MTAALPPEAAGKPVEIWFTDEARVGQQGTLTRVWAKRGSRPRAPRDRRFEWAYLFGAVCPERSVGAAIVMPEVNIAAMNEHMAEIRPCGRNPSHAFLADSRIGACSNHCVTGIRESDMLTGMTERDWLIALEVFDAVQSSRGQPGRDDRKFLEAIHYFTVHSISWRALPDEFGNWNSVWKWFWRLSRSGVFEAFFQVLAECSETAHLIQFFDSTTARAHVSAAGAKRGQQHQALGRSRGGFSTKIHLKTDLDGRPLDFHLTGGEASDSTQFETSLDIGPDIRPRIAVTDKGYDSEANRVAARARGITPVIPRRENSKQRGRFFPKRMYKLRARIEQTIGKLKRYKRVAMRCEKTDTSYAAFISFACGLMLVKSVHTA